MKLKKLIICGFGPYAQRQELDFETHLKDKRMFVITGNTGAGKTTIFDAINFALYGEPSGSDREGKSLRSDFASIDTPTEVELFFSLRDNIYYIKRSPQYFRAKQRGEGLTESKSSAELKLPNSKVITGPKEVTREIEDILGITSEQFKQLLMIPQGEFKKLLVSDSDKKEDIFRKIFGTNMFSEIQNEIKERGNALKKAIDEIQRQRASRIRAFKVKEDEELKSMIDAQYIDIISVLNKFEEFITKSENQQNALKKEFESAEDLIEKLSKEITISEDINKRLESLEVYKDKLKSLNDRKEVYSQKSLKLELGKKALQIQTFEEKYTEITKKYEAAVLELEESDKRLNQYKTDMDQSETRLKNQKILQKDKDQLIKDIEKNEKLKEKLMERENQEKIIKDISQNIENMNEIFLKAEKDKVSLEQRFKNISNSIEEIQEVKNSKSNLELKESKLINRFKSLNRLEENIKLWTEKKERHVKGSKIYEETDIKYKRLKNEYDILEDRFLRNQAGLIAKMLEDDKPCPVCGSNEHPNPARLEHEDIDEKSIKSAKEAAEKEFNNKQKYLDILTGLKSDMKTLEKDIIWPIVKEEFHGETFLEIDEIKAHLVIFKRDFEETLKNLKSEIDELNKKILKEALLKKEKNDIEIQLKNLETNLKDISRKLSDKSGDLRAEKEKLDAIEKEFEYNIIPLENLIQNEHLLKSKLKSMEKDYEEAEKNYNMCKDKLQREHGINQSCIKSLKSLSLEKTESQEKLEMQIKLNKFSSYEDYFNSKIDIKELENTQREIKFYEGELAATKTLYEEGMKSTEGLSKKDISSLVENLNKEKKLKSILSEKLQENYLTLSHNKDIVLECKALTREIQKDEDRFKDIGRLSKIINGDNDKKISFERYVLGAYFEEIIEAANIRFSKMTSNRYELVRKEDVGDKRKGQGLDLEVFDNYTGKKRDVKTLSGGEGFKASLSMALGLADVVQSHAGGIQLDTIFIDEGFGTLDPESLEGAIDCLANLQKDGRLVGIISHVQDLKDRIDARLEVRATNRGSEAIFVV